MRAHHSKLRVCHPGQPSGSCQLGCRSQQKLWRWSADACCSFRALRDLHQLQWLLLMPRVLLRVLLWWWWLWWLHSLLWLGPLC
jgi:hypothetical protein